MQIKGIDCRRDDNKELEVLVARLVEVVNAAAWIA